VQTHATGLTNSHLSTLALSRSAGDRFQAISIQATHWEKAVEGCRVCGRDVYLPQHYSAWQFNVEGTTTHSRLRAAVSE